MNRQTLQAILNRAETEEMLFGWEDVSEWTKGTLDKLRGLRLLRPASPASTMGCFDCERECLAAPAMIVERPNGTRQAYLECPEYVRVEKPIDRLNRWQVDIEGLAARLAQALGDQCEEIMPGRLWMVGRLEIGGARTEVLLARGLAWPDGERVLREARSRRRSQAAVVLVPARAGDDAAFDGSVEIVPLDEALRLDGDVLSVDVSAIRQAAEAAQAASVVASGGRPEGYRFRRDGQRWSVVYDGKHISLNDSDGATYIAYMLEHPNTGVPVTVLYEVAHPPPRDESVAQCSDMSPEERLDLLLDDRSPSDKRDYTALFVTYRGALSDLEREYDEVLARKERHKAYELKARIDDLSATMSAEFGLDGQPRQPGDPNKLAYDRVSRAIKAVQTHIVKDHPSLAAHLKNSLHYDTYTYTYSPEPSLDWET